MYRTDMIDHCDSKNGTTFTGILYFFLQPVNLIGEVFR